MDITSAWYQVVSSGHLYGGRNMYMHLKKIGKNRFALYSKKRKHTTKH